MPTTTHAEFDTNTEALEVAKAFGDGIRGKTVIITGVNRAGIGYTTAEAFASQAPAHVIVTGRTTKKLQESIEALKSKYPNVDYRALQMDLSNQQSVRAAAARVLGWSDMPTIDFLINSAGVMLVPERTLSVDGIEITFATNYIGHFLFTCLLMPKLIKAAENSPKGSTRVVNVSSRSPEVARMRWSDMSYEVRNKDLPEQEQPVYQLLRFWGVEDPENESYTPIESYNVSKVAILLFGIALTKRMYEKYGILSLALHPGIIQTELGRDAPPKTAAALAEMMKKGVYKFKSQGAGGATSLVAALDPKLGPGEVKDGKENYGAYLADCQISDAANPLAASSSEAEKLWKLSEEMVKQKFEW